MSNEWIEEWLLTKLNLPMSYDDLNQMEFLGEDCFIFQRIHFFLSSLAYNNLDINVIDEVSNNVYRKYFESREMALN